MKNKLNYSKLAVFNKKLLRLSEIRGEWWIMDGQPNYADGSIGDKGHAEYVIEHIMRKYAPEEYDHGEYIDWDKFTKDLLEENETQEVQETPELSTDLNPELPGLNLNKSKKNTNKSLSLLERKLSDLGMTKEEMDIVNSSGKGATEYGIKVLGWQRVVNNNIETQNLTESDINSISAGLAEAYPEDEEMNFNIEVRSTNTVYEDVPISVIDQRNLQALMPYRYKYAKNTKFWFIQALNLLKDNKHE